MATEKTIRIGINLTGDDRKILRKVKSQLQAEHGKLTTTAIYRKALRRLLEDNEQDSRRNQSTSASILPEMIARFYGNRTSAALERAGQEKTSDDPSH